MAKAYTRYVCQVCGKVTSQPFGRCPACDSWDSMVEEVVEPESSRSARQVRGLNASSQPKRIGEISEQTEERLPVAMEEFARVLGGGIVPGSIVLIGGDPGIGKSTLTLQMAMQLADENVVLYVSGEESERQIKMRADRLAQQDDAGQARLPQNL